MHGEYPTRVHGKNTQVSLEFLSSLRSAGQYTVTARPKNLAQPGDLFSVRYDQAMHMRSFNTNELCKKSYNPKTFFNYEK